MERTARLHLRRGRDALPALQSTDSGEIAEIAEKLRAGFEIVPPIYLFAMSNPALDPCIPTAGKQVPAGPDWLHEIKHDGYRLIVQRDGKRVRLFTRNGNDFTDRYP